LSSPTPWRGIFPIPVTPFKPDLSIDYDSLRRQVQFCLSYGAHGLVYPAVVSEFFTLSDAERRSVLETVLDEVNGRVPVIAGVTATSTPIATGLARDAAAMQIDGVMSMVPYVKHFFSPDMAYISRHFQSLAGAIGQRPIIMQNARIGHPIPIASLPALLQAAPTIRYLKQETGPSPHQLSAAIQAVGEQLDGVFAGIGGVYLITELDRGAAGSMPAPPFVDVLVRAYEHYQNGERAQARALQTRLGSLFTYELLYNVSIIKEILRRREVIEHTTCRTPASHLDETDAREIDELFEGVQDILGRGSG